MFKPSVYCKESNLKSGLDSRSTPRTIRIVEDKEIVDRVEQQLGSIGEILRRLDERQHELLERLQDGSDVESADQATLTDQIESRARATRALAEQLQQSRIEDAQLSPMLDALDTALAEAQEQSERAAQSLDRDQDQQANERMQDVREELGDAIAMLDRGQDTWLARRAIEDLRSQVEGILQDTKQLGAQTGGRSVGQLSEDERSMLQKILDKQRRVAQDARETIDELDAQADALDKNNPTGAQGIRDAATQGRNSGIEEQLAQAGDEIAQNQTSSAAGTQQQVLEELDKMLEQIEEAQKNRDSALRRKLASIMESIKAIIEDQTHELARLDRNEPNLDEPLIALRNNTLGIRERRRFAG
jgi:DNA repair exonuclease SbcCD ATPase subunit